jgi:hypothetical protein
MLRSPFGVSRESQRLDSQDAWTTLQACSSTASGNAQALPKAMLKHAEGLPCAGGGEHEQIMRGRRRRGRSAVQSLMAKLVAGLG